MALSAPPFAEQNASHSAALFRQAVGSSYAQAHGVLGNNDFLVTAQSTPNMSVQANAGQAWVQGTSTGLITGIGVGQQGSYFVLSDTAVTLSITAAHPTLGRIDVAYLRILDTAVGDGSNTAILGVVTGTASGSPAVPALPANSLDLGHITVGAGVTSITNANIAYAGRDTGGTLVTNQAIPGGVVRISQEASLPSFATKNPQFGQLVFTADTYNLWLYLGGGNWQGVTNLSGTSAAGTVYASAAQTGIALNAFTTIPLNSQGGGFFGSLADGAGFTIPANQGGYYWVDGMISATNFGSQPAEFTCYVTVNGTFGAASAGARTPITGTGTAWHTSVALGGRIMLLSAGDVIRLVGLANTTWDTYAPNATTTPWLSIARLFGNSKVIP